MRKVFTAGALVLVLGLGGCTEADINAWVQAKCKWVPTAKMIKEVLTAILGAPPLAGVGYVVAEQAVTAICTAAEKKKASGTRSTVVFYINNKPILLQGKRL